MQKRDRALRVRRRLEDGPVVVGENLDPGVDIARMVGARLQFGRDAEIGAEETTAEFGDEFFARALGLVFVIAAEIAVEPMRRRRPMNIMPISA